MKPQPRKAMRSGTDIGYQNDTRPCYTPAIVRGSHHADPTHAIEPVDNLGEVLPGRLPHRDRPGLRVGQATHVTPVARPRRAYRPQDHGARGRAPRGRTAAAADGDAGG